MRYWTPLQRIHQMNEYFSVVGEYRNFGFWLKFVQTFFDPECTEDLTWLRIDVEGGELYELPLMSLGRLLYLWALEGATQFRWQLDSVQEQMLPGSLQLQCQLIWTVDYDGGLSIARQCGPCRFSFRNGSAALMSEMEWRVREWGVFYSQRVAGLVSGGEERMPFGFPKAVLEFLTMGSVTGEALMVKELGSLLINRQPIIEEESVVQ